MRPSSGSVSSNSLRLSHLRREVKTALELGLAALAPTPVVDDLAKAAGLLEALAEFPSDTPNVSASMPRVLELAEDALEQWRNWQANRLKRA
jgi:hypothetical protein